MKALFILVLLLLAGSPVGVQAYEVIGLEVKGGDKAREKVWTAALAADLGGRTTGTRLTHGRADIITGTMVIEVDFLAKYHEGIGQAWHYHRATGLQGALALIVTAKDLDRKDSDTYKLLQYIDRELCQPLGLQLFVLVAGKR